ncbi:MAG: hypothetical protein V4544_06160 [Pseudomonadota bacterium]
MSFIPLLIFFVVLNTAARLCMADSQIVPMSQLLLNSSQKPHEKTSLSTDKKTVDSKTIATENANNKSLSNPLRKIAENVRDMIEEYTKRRNLAEKRGDLNRYDELLKDANDLAKEIEAASNEHDMRMEQYQKGDIKSGEQAVRLTELIQSRTEPFNSLLWRMDQVIAEIKHDDTTMPERTAYEGIPPTSKLVPLTSRTQQEEPLSTKRKLCDDEEEDEVIQKHKSLQPLKTKDEDLENMGA